MFFCFKVVGRSNPRLAEGIGISTACCGIGWWTSRLASTGWSHQGCHGWTPHSKATEILKVWQSYISTMEWWIVTLLPIQKQRAMAQCFFGGKTFQSKNSNFSKTRYSSIIILIHESEVTCVMMSLLHLFLPKKLHEKLRRFKSSRHGVQSAVQIWSHRRCRRWRWQVKSYRGL